MSSLIPPTRRPGVATSLGNHEARIRALERAHQNVVMRAPNMMGVSIGGAGLSNGFVFFNANLVRNDPLYHAGDTISLDFSHFGAAFSWVGIRLHIVTGLSETDYDWTQPWEADPWNGGIGAPSAADPYPSRGGWIGVITFIAITNDDGEVVTWTLPDVGAVAEQYTFDDTGVGHIGYMIHDFGPVRVPGNVTVAYSGGSTERNGAIIWNNTSGAFTLGAMVGEAQGATTTKRLGITLTADVPDGSALLLAAAAKTAPGTVFSDAADRGTFWRGSSETNRVPFVVVNGEYVELSLGERHLGGIS